MGIALLRRLCGLLLALLLLAGGSPASAAPEHELADCHAFSDAGTSYAQLAAAPGRWDCANRDWNSSQPVAWLRFDAAGWADGAVPERLISRNAVFRSLTLTAVDRDGSTRSRRYTAKQVTPIPSGPNFVAKLPPITPETEAVIARFELPFSVTILTEARLSAQPDGAIWSSFMVIVVALMAGMIIAPIFFDVLFYLVLRERFVVLHAGTLICMLLYLMSMGGLFPALMPLSMPMIATIGPLSWAGAVALAAFFCSDFLEPEALSPRMRKLLVYTGIWTLALPGFFSLQIEATHAFSNNGYFIAFIPVTAVFVAAIAQAAYRRSRAARFIIVAWLPIIAGGLERLTRGLGLYVAKPEVDVVLFVAMGLEAVIIALGVGDRLLTLRRERDSAQSDVQALEHLAIHDPLTGLMNRRALEPHFERLHSEGFNCMAVVDLDHFKQVNDHYGHAVGDDVLRIVARALAPDPDTLAYRMGGEEFVLLLRGRNARERAEHRRHALSLRIARELGGLDRIVTASMGVIEIPRAAIRNSDFAELYAHADSLLYQAKEAGRNQTVHERLAASSGDAPKPSRRSSAA